MRVFRFWTAVTPVPASAFLSAVVCLIIVRPTFVHAQSVSFGRTNVILGAPAADVVTQLSKEFMLKPNHGRYETWYIESVQVRGADTTYRIDGQLVALDGRVTSIMKVLSPERATAASVGESLFSMLERVAGDGADCRITTKRQGIESGPGAGGTMLQTSIKCGSYEGDVTQVQGGEGNISHEPSLSFVLRSS